MRRVAVLALLVLAGCGGSSKPAATPTTTAAPPTTAVSVCVHVSSFFAEQTLKPHTSAKLGATAADSTHWYVANADGAVWVTTIDPSSAAGQGGLLAPMNRAAVAAADYGQPPRDDPRIAGFFSDAGSAVQAIDCAKRA